MRKISATNEFVIRFATVNGSGSASANNLFAKAIFRLGIPVSPKNIFPSNIQGLPTWYEVRVSEKGYLGRRGGTDMVVAINGQTLAQDYAELLPGGYFVYDASKPLERSLQRDDIVEIGVPLTTLVNEHFSDPRQRQLFKNIVYVGAVAYLLEMGLEIFNTSLKKQFKTKPKLVAPNQKALKLGYDYAAEHFENCCGLSVKPCDNVGDSILIDGNTATGLGAIYGGATVAAWYPITPSTSVVDGYDKFSQKLRIDSASGRKNYAIVQAEDELAALGMVLGASWSGARSFTATSGPGISLMNELLGLAYFSEIPAVLFNVQRAGPSTGMPTRTQQSDVLFCAYASHGDTKHVLLFPADSAECFEMAALSFDLADRLQTPIMVLSDLDLGMNDNMCRAFSWDDERRYDRGKVLDAEQLDELSQTWGRYQDVDGDGIGYRTYPGTHPTKGMYFTRGSSHDEYARYTESSEAYEYGMQRLLQKFETAKALIPAPETKRHEAGCKIGAIYYGTSRASAIEALDLFAEKNILIDSMRLKGFPFSREVEDFIAAHEQVFVIEQNRDGQMRTLLINECEVPPSKLVSILNYDGMPITATFISARISAAMERASKNELASVDAE